MLPDLASVVVDAEAAHWQAGVGDVPGVLRLLALVALVRAQELVEFGEEGVLIDHARAQALLVQHGQDPSGALCRDERMVSPQTSPSESQFGPWGELEPQDPSTGRATHVLNQVADDAVVKKLHRGPLDALRVDVGQTHR